MPHFNFRNIKVSGVTAAVPKTVVKSESYNEQFGEETVEKFVDMTGVKEVRKTSEHQTASDLGFVAAEKLLKEKNIDRSKVGALVFVAHSTDYRRPATACVLQKRLGLSMDCVCFDVNLGCSAFVYGMTIIGSLMQSSDIEIGLLVVGETMTKMVHPNDRSSVMLFGDGGGAVLFEREEGAEAICGALKSDGERYKAIIAPAGGFRNMHASHETMVWADGNERTLYNTIMNGTGVFQFTISDVPATISEFLEKNGKTVEDYDCFAMHQANRFIHKQLIKKLKIEQEKMPLSLDRFGNTSAGAIPITICDAFGESKEAKDINFFMCGFGVGLSWGIVTAKINTADILPIIESDEYFEEGVINCPEDL